MRLFLATLVLAATPGFAAHLERSLPIFFFPNTGQTDASIQYVVQTQEMRAGFRRDSAVFRIHDHQVSVRFLGANPTTRISGTEMLAGKVNFFLGTSDW